MDFVVPPELDGLAEQARRFAETTLADDERSENSWLISPSRRFSLALGELGWLGLTWPREFGGGGRSPLERLVIFETLISEGAPLASSWFADRQIGPTLIQFATSEQRERLLPGIISGDSMWCIGMSEPDAGSDVASLRTRAELHDDTWIVNGQKVWTSGAQDADWCYLIARTDPDAPPHKGLSEFVVDMKSPGIEVRPIVDMIGGSHFCEVLFDNVAVPASNLVGTPNDSFRQVMRQMEHERGGIDRLVSNLRLYRDVLGLADVTDPVIRNRIAAIETGYRIGRLLVVREVLGQAPAGFSAVTKTFCTEFEVLVAQFCAHLAGAQALLWNRVSQGICYSPAYTIMGGTTNILRNIIGERILGLQREPKQVSAALGFETSDRELVKGFTDHDVDVGHPRN